MMEVNGIQCPKASTGKCGDDGSLPPTSRNE
jgi:hypothetical protein